MEEKNTVINDQKVLQEIIEIFEAYEKALMTNDLHTLNNFFWEDERVTRYGIADRQLGYKELLNFRENTPAPNFTRELENLRITTFGNQVAICQVEFTRSDTTLRGFQTQTWVKILNEWKIASAHVSMIPFN